MSDETTGEKTGGEPAPAASPSAAPAAPSPIPQTAAARIIAGAPGTTTTAAAPQRPIPANTDLFITPIGGGRASTAGAEGAAAAARAKARRWEAIWLVIATGISLLATPVGAVAAILSPMVFDPHQNLWNPAAWIAFFLIVSFWMVCIAAPFGAWVAYARRLPVLTWLAMSTPVVWVLAAVACVGFLPG